LRFRHFLANYCFEKLLKRFCIFDRIRVYRFCFVQVVIFFFGSESIWYIWVLLVLIKRSTACVDQNAGNGELPKGIADITQIEGNVFVPVS